MDGFYFPHSLGIFYEALTQYLGFPHYGDEYKVMGLAPYGSPIYLDAMRQIVRLMPDGWFELDLSYFRHHVARRLPIGGTDRRHRSRRLVFTGAGGTVGPPPASRRTRSNNAIATSRGRRRRCTKKPSFI